MMILIHGVINTNNTTYSYTCNEHKCKYNPSVRFISKCKHTHKQVQWNVERSNSHVFIRRHMLFQLIGSSGRTSHSMPNAHQDQPVSFHACEHRSDVKLFIAFFLYIVYMRYFPTICSFLIRSSTEQENTNSMKVMK